jgi:CRISPR system Cascade subunit CasD
MANTLFLHLEGPLQAWGERARWSVRDTASEPTKSGIIGLLACALGWNDDERIARLSSNIRFGVRCDRPGVIMRDYHTVVGGVLSAEGIIKKTATTKRVETVVSNRYYLFDASFLAVVQSNPDIIALLAAAVQEPVWPYFLGRKSCPMTRAVYGGTGEYKTLDEALLLPIEVNEPTSEYMLLRGVIECAGGERDAIRRRDEIASRQRRTFNPRYTREYFMEVPVRAKEVGCTSPD